MSKYLIDRIANLPNVEIVRQTEVSALHGTEGHLDAITWRDRRSNETTRKYIRHLFLFIGADPNTDWLANSGVALDDKGFVKTGAEIAADHRLFETSLEGVFAVGDVRCSSVKRVAAAVGEGSGVVSTIHRHLADGSVPHT